MVKTDFPLIFERGKEGRTGYSLPEMDVPEVDLDAEFSDADIRQDTPDLPEVSELDLIRHYTALSKRNHGIDDVFYPLGSCTMKYNPKINEDAAALPGFAAIHPHQEPEAVQGAMEMMYDLQASLAEITGMHSISLQTAAGAQGEFTGLMMIRAFHEANLDFERTEVIIPDSAHGTNAASASVAGMNVVTVKTNSKGLVDTEDLKRVASEKTAAFMLTNPNTLGLFETEVTEMADIIHNAGGRLYYDGANIQAIMGYARPADMGFDVVHLNLHKTFTGPHGGGGPGSGPVGVTSELEPYLPKPVLTKTEDNNYYFNEDRPKSIGRIKTYYGNFGINLRAYTYIRTMGAEGLHKVSEYAVLNANYMMRSLEDDYELPYPQHCKHEFVLSGRKQKKLGVRTLDIAKRLLDYGHHPPTIYFPLNVEEAMMTEPTETESKETLDDFIAAMNEISKEVKDDPELVQEAPLEMVVRRMDETTAARKPILRYQKT